MKKFAQIINNKVHWIFQCEQKPQFAPYITLIDITDRNNIKEGWYYDENTKTFSEIDSNVIIVEETIDLEKVAMAEAIVNLTLEVENLKTQINGGTV